LTSPLLEKPIEKPPMPETGRVAAPEAGARGWVVGGLYRWRWWTRKPISPPTSLPFHLAPSVTIKNLTVSGDEARLTLECRPSAVRAGAGTVLLFADRTVPPGKIVTPADKSQPTTLTFRFDVSKEPGKYAFRLRTYGVDRCPMERAVHLPSVDSLPYALEVSDKDIVRLVFDPQHQVIIE
jgi:hypothetical protein